MATFRRLPDDSWGVLVSPTETITSGSGEDDGLGPRRAPVPGSTVTIIKRNGERRQVVLGALVSHDANGWVFKIAPRHRSDHPSTDIGSLSGILALFERARAHLRYPAIVLAVGSAVIRISMAGEDSRVPGALNITALDDYVDGRRRWFGRVLPNGSFVQVSGDPAISRRLQELAANPTQVASEHGRLTGRCCFCNRPLEDERSTAVGYGPVCADHFGLPWGERSTDFAAASRIEPMECERLAAAPVVQANNGEDDGLVLRRTA